MKTRFILAALSVATALLGSANAQHPPLADFGHECMKEDGVVATGARRHLIILLDDDKMGGDFPVDFGESYYQNLVFNALATRTNIPPYSEIPPLAPPSPPGRAGSVNGFMIENSNGRFSIAPAIGVAHSNGVIGPLVISNAESDEIADNMIDRVVNGMTIGGDQSVQGRIALDAAVQAGLVLADFDSNNDGVVTPSELTLIIIKTRAVAGKTTGGENRGLNRIPPNQPNGGTTRYSGRFVGGLRDIDFATLAHEISHTFGTNDIYSRNKKYYNNDVDFNYRHSLMGSTITTPHNPSSFHLDCWHKMTLGWCEPRVVSMKQGGIFTIPAAHLNNTSAPLLIYHPDKGTNEYFMLEYRASSVNAAHNFDAQLPASGIHLWHVQMAAGFANPLIFDKRATSIPSPWPLTQLDSKPGDIGHPIYVSSSALNAVWMEGPTNANGHPGINGVWAGGTTSFYLRWNDGITSACRFHVRPFLPSDQSVTVEILAEHDTWVDLTYGGVETGEFNTPYNTMYEGVINAGWGGKLKCKGPRSGTLSIILDKPMTITAEGGPVTISEP